MRFRLSQAATIAGLVVVFLVANRGAYQGYFSDDDLDNLANTMLAGFDIFWRGFGSFVYDPFNFRPPGHLVYRWMGQAWGLHFAPYVMLIQFVHLLNGLLVYRVARFSLEHRGAAIAAIFFAFHPALLAAHWKPMYIFDLLCGLALMSAYYCYRRGWWIGSFVLFWCAYKSKEIAILFPLVLLLDEWRGERRWLRWWPFVAISLSFSGQALIANSRRPASPYTLHFNTAAMGECLRFYLRASWGLPWFFLAGWAWLKSEERRWMTGGILAATMLMGPLLFLPGRLFAVYLYVPLMFGSVAAGAALGRCSAPILVVALLSYAGFGLRELRAFRRAELTQAQTTREFVESACAVLKGQKGLNKATHEGGPAGLNTWGVEGAIRLCSGNLWLVLQQWDLKKISAEEPVIRWTKMPGLRGVVELTSFDGELSGDWFAWDGSFRWMGEKAGAKVKAVPGDRRLVLDLAAAPAEEIELVVNGTTLGNRHLIEHGEQMVNFEMSTRQKEETLVVELLAKPARRIGSDPRELALAVRSIKATP